jgi:predicted nuclease with TOPRIM domain
MSFSGEDFHDLIRLLEERPEWRTELRRLILAEELADLPKQLAELRVATEQRFKELVEAQARTDGRLEALAEQMSTLTEQMSVLTERVATTSDDVAELKGKGLEAEYRAKGPVYFSWVVRRSHVLSSEEIAGLIESAQDSGRLSDAEALELYAADVVVRGKSREDGATVYLVVEVSWGVGRHDVQRAVKRAELWSRMGTSALPVVAGRWVTPEAEHFCRYHPVWQVTNGGAVPPSTRA